MTKFSSIRATVLLAVLVVLFAAAASRAHDIGRQHVHQPSTGFSLATPLMAQEPAQEPAQEHEAAAGAEHAAGAEQAEDQGQDAADAPFAEGGPECGPAVAEGRQATEAGDDHPIATGMASIAVRHVYLTERVSAITNR